MTTKIKIITGFVVMILLQALIAVIGYQAAGDAENGFTNYRRLARLSTASSDLESQMLKAADSMGSYIIFKKPEYHDNMREANKSAVKLAEHVMTFITMSETRKMAEDIQKGLDTLSKLQEQVIADIDSAYSFYDQQMRVHGIALGEELDKITGNIVQAGNVAAMDHLADIWRVFSSARSNVSRYGENRDRDSAEYAKKNIVEIMGSLKQLEGALQTSQGRTFFSDLMAAVTKYDTSFATLRELNEKGLTSMASVEQNARAIFKSLADLNKICHEQMDAAGPAMAAAVSAAQTKLLSAGAGGLIAGILIAVIIVIGIVRMLAKLVTFATEVSNGNFDYKVQITEKGEVGQTVRAVQRIPEALNLILEEYRELEHQIEFGSLLTKGHPEKYNGGFSTLVRGTNSILERFVLVLESIPSPVVMLDKDLKAAYINATARSVAGEPYLGKTCSELFNRDDYNTDACGLKQALKTKKSASGVTRAHPQGRDMDISYTAIPMYDKSGELVSVLQLITDITEIKETQRTIENVATRAVEVSNRVAAASEELSAQVEQVSRGADMQRERVDTTASAMTEMNATALEVARNASTASEQSEMTREKAQNGSDLVEQVVGAISEVNTVAGRMQKNMLDLGEQAESIGGVMNVISDIADQTNLLALNAAIEAARAGEAGRGFAVVADEVRKLAEKTMQATQEVGSSITAIQSSTRRNIDEMEDAAKGVSKATELAESSGTALKEIVDLASSSSSVVASIATAAEELSSTSEEVSMSTNEINRIVGETSEGMVQSSAAVQELSQTAQELNRIMAELSKK